MRNTIFVALMVLATAYADWAIDSIRSTSRCRSLSAIESSAIYGGRNDPIYECKKKADCWNLLPYLCSEISLDPAKNGSDLGTVSQKCSQTFQVELYKNGPNEECQESEKEKNSCYLKDGPPVACRRVTKCVWNSQLQTCELSSTYGEDNAPADCLNL